MDRPKWNIDDENLREGDLVYFKMTDSKLAADWRLGKIEYVIQGRDDRIRNVGISYKCDTEGDGYRHSVVERPSRATVKLWNVEDTTLLDDMKNAHELAAKLLNKEKFNDAKDDLDDEKETVDPPSLAPATVASPSLTPATVVSPSLTPPTVGVNIVNEGQNDESTANGVNDFRLDAKYANEQEESARYYSQTMNKFDVNSSDATSSETFTTSCASSQIGVKTKNILENVSGKRAAFALYGVLQPDVKKGGIEKPDTDELNDKIYLL